MRIKRKTVIASLSFTIIIIAALLAAPILSTNRSDADTRTDQHNTATVSQSSHAASVQLIQLMNEQSCQQKSVPVGTPPPQGFVLASEATRRDCETRASRAKAAEAQEKLAAEQKARRTRLTRLQEVGHYEGRAHFFALNKVAPSDRGVLLTIRETDVLRNRLIIPVEIQNRQGMDSAEASLTFTLMIEDGTELNCDQIIAHEGHVESRANNTIAIPRSGEKTSVILRFARENESGRFALAVNGKSVFHITGYGWNFWPFGAPHINGPRANETKQAHQLLGRLLRKSE
jgi:hypothetical protein